MEHLQAPWHAWLMLYNIKKKDSAMKPVIIEGQIIYRVNLDTNKVIFPSLQIATQSVYYHQLQFLNKDNERKQVNRLSCRELSYGERQQEVLTKSSASPVPEWSRVWRLAPLQGR